MDHLDQLRTALGKAEAKLKRLEAQLAVARIERDELDTAVRVVERLTNSSTSQSTSSRHASENGQIIFSQIGQGQANAMAPKEIIEILEKNGHILGHDLVRTQLWRMAKRNEIRQADGKYWRPVTSDNQLDDSPNIHIGSASNTQRRTQDDTGDGHDEWEKLIGSPGEGRNHSFSDGFDDDDMPF